MNKKQTYQVLGIVFVVINLLVDALVLTKVSGMSSDWLIPISGSALMAGYFIGLSKKK